MTVKILLKDYLQHEKYNWPMTKLSYPIELEEPVEEGNWKLVDAQGASVPMQVTDICKDGELVKSLTLHFIANLLKGEEKEYYFVTGKGNSYAKARTNLVSPFSVAVDKKKHSFMVSCKDKRMVCSLPFEEVEYQTVCSGDIFDEILIICKGGKGEEYRLNVRRIAKMPFWELQESMFGFSEEEQAEMCISYEGFDFTHRHSWERPVEKIDAYLKENGELPVVVMSYENFVPWFQSKYIAFLGKECSAGLFIRDNLEWDDEKYPIWGSNRDFGITFRYEEGRVTAHFPMKNGKRFVGIAAYEGCEATYIEALWRWYSWLHLDKVKNWILSWNENQEQYPMFFRKEQGKPIIATDWNYKCGEMLDGHKMTNVIDEQSPSVNGRKGAEPVSNREFATWAVIIDLTADEMTTEEFARTKAFFAFMAYVCMDENYMPVKNMLAGHPNFLADTASVPGLFGAMFPAHPEAEMFRQYFNKTVELNMKYHIRPDVAAYESIGGRETENLTCYSFAMLRPYMHVCKLYELSGYPIPLVCENGAKWLNWMTNCVSAPVNGERLIPPQGAHCRKSVIPYSLYEFAQLMEKEYPEIAGNTYAVCEGSTLECFEYDYIEDDIFRTLFHKKEEKGQLALQSVKFTGYGCILREAVGTSEEISVHVQQLDLGPNYRWGGFENTGNGGIHYYAAGKRYSFNAQEDTGDRNLGAEEGNCGFAVLKRNTYHNIGFQDLTEPLRDFPVVKQIKLLAGKNIRAYYQYRRVSLVEKDYVVLYDAVTHMRARGRFLWTVNALEEFPQIYQLMPGVDGVACRVSETDYTGTKEYVYNLKPENQSKSMVYDGFGNFLTIVSHRKDLETQKTDYGAVVFLPERTDYIFEDEAKVRYQSENMCFEGYSGIISVHKDGSIRGAMTEGRKIGVEDMLFELEGKGAVYFERESCNNSMKWSGRFDADEVCTVRIGGYTTVLEKGKYIWLLKDGIMVEQLPKRHYDGLNGFVRDTRSHEFGFSGFEYEKRGAFLMYPEEG